jgi:hypothetical protein
MKVRLIKSLLCGLLIAAPTGVFAASNNYNNSRSNSAGVAVTGSKPVDSQRQGRGVAAGRGGGAFSTVQPNSKPVDAQRTGRGVAAGRNGGAF